MLFIVVKIYSSKTISLLGLIPNTIIAVFCLIAITLLFVSIIYRTQYEKVDKDKTLLLDKQNRRLQTTCNQKTYCIHNADIESIVIYDSWNAKSLLPGYLRINLLNGNSFIVTGFLASQFDLAAVFKGKTTKTKRRFMNRISKKDIKQQYLNFY